MIDFIVSHPYLTIWVVLFTMFWRATQCGLVVDDDVRAGMMVGPKKAKFNSVKSFIWYLRQAAYGAGAFRNAMQDHIFTVALHGVNCCLIYLAAVPLLGPWALLAALFYLINPINNQTVLWLNGRRYALSVLFVLIAWNFWWTAPAMAFLAAYVHVTGMMLPFLALWTPLWPIVPVLAGLVGLGGWDWVAGRLDSRKSDFKPENENQKIHPKKIILYVKTLGYQFLNCVFPNKPAMYHDFLFYFSSTEEGNKDGYALNWDFWKGIAVIVFLAWDHSFWSFWFVLFISQWCNIYQVTMNASDRYCSLPNVGVMVLLVKYLMMVPDPFRAVAIGAVAAFYIVKYQPLFIAYRNVENFHLYHIAQQPDIINPRFFLSKIYIARKDPHQAFGVIRQGMRYRPYDFKLMLGFIECMFLFGKPKAALKAMDICEKHTPLNEAEDCKALFDGLRKQHQKEYDDMHDLVNGNKRYHNNGKPYIKSAVKP
jgi:hypothetical protein